MSLPRHIVLVGLMGSGKSTVGAQLAKKLNYGFVDTDALVAKGQGKSISRIFEEDGEAAFRLAELAALDVVLEDETPRVIATGGGIVSTKEVRDLLNQEGSQSCCVWLQISPEQAVARISDKSTRPLLQGSDPVARLTVIERERSASYAEVADIELAVDALSVREVADQLCRLLEEWN